MYKRKAPNFQAPEKAAGKIGQAISSASLKADFDDRADEFMMGEIPGLKKYFGDFTPNIWSLLVIIPYTLWGMGFSFVASTFHFIGLYPGPKYWSGWAIPGLEFFGLAVVAAFMGFFVLWVVMRLPVLKRRNWARILLLFAFPVPFSFAGIVSEIYDPSKLVKNLPLNSPGYTLDYISYGWGVGEILIMVIVTVVSYGLPLLWLSLLMLGKRR